MSGRVENLQSALALLASIEPAARQQLAEELGELGEKALALQMAAAPFRTGRLRNALTIAQALNGMRVRVGYPDLKGGRDPRFYAIMQEYGVKAGEKRVTRRIVRPGMAGKRGRKAVAGRTKPYEMHWAARAAHPFVHQESQFDQLLADVQERFWARALARVEE